MYRVEVSPATDLDETFSDYAAAVAYADRIADAWENASIPSAQADRAWASRANMYAIQCGATTIEVVREED